MSWFSDTSNTVVHAAEDGGSQATQGAEQTFGAIVDAAVAAAPPPPSGSPGNVPAMPSGTQQTIFATTSEIIDSAADLARSAGGNLGRTVESWASPGLQGLAFGARKLEQFAGPGEQGLDLWVYAFEAGMTVGISGLVLGIAFAVRGVEVPAMVVDSAGRLVVAVGAYWVQKQKQEARHDILQMQSDLSRLSQKLHQLAALIRAAEDGEQQELNRYRNAAAQQGAIYNAINRAASALDDLRRAPDLTSIAVLPSSTGSGRIPIPYPNLPQQTSHFNRLDDLLRQLVPVLQSQPQGLSRAIGMLQDARERLTANLQTVTQVQRQMRRPKIVPLKHY